MEKVLTTNNGQANWQKLSTFGLHSRGGQLGFNRYSGFNGSVYLVDKATGMKVLFMAGQKPRSERAPKADRTPMKRGRPAMFGPIQAKEPGKRGRPALYSHPIMFREPMKRGRKAMQGPIERLIFAGPLRKRGPKPGIKAQSSTETPITATQPAQKRGKMSEAERIKSAKVGEVIKANGGGFWKIIAPGLPSYIPA